MAAPSSSQPPAEESTTDNPVVAVGRKVKSVLSTHQRPSVRILRGKSTGTHRRMPVSKATAEKLKPHLKHHARAHGPEGREELAEHYAPHAEAHDNASTGNRFSRIGSSIRSIFGDDKHEANHDGAYEDEFDADTVDLLDVVGMQLEHLY